MNLLEIKNLTIQIGETPVVRGINLAVAPGETVGLVGESGSGKSMTALAILRLIPSEAQMTGSIQFDGRSLLTLNEDEMCDLRGRKIGIIFQEPMTALNPLLSIGEQISEVLRIHGVSRRKALQRAGMLLARVGLDPGQIEHKRYPHELSGGQRQRVIIATAMALKPRLLIADEPTSALDVTTQARILDLLRHLVREDGSSLLLITHDLGVVADMASRVIIMREGEIVEQGPCPALFHNLRHPYSRTLLGSAIPAAAKSGVFQATETPILEATRIVRNYRLSRQKTLCALNNVSLRIMRRERIGLIGESGSGKSTLARILLGLDPPDQGKVSVLGEDFFSARFKRQRQLRRHVQAVFQDPYGSFNPRQRVGRVVAEPLYLEDTRLSRKEQKRRVISALEDVELRSSDVNKFPHQFSGGQRQRIAIARALVLRPALVILDEPLSALDVSIRAQILDLLTELNQRLGIAYLFISHDLLVVRKFVDRVLVIQSGKVVEKGETSKIFSSPSHEYTRSLIHAAPDIERSMEKATNE